MKVIRNLPTVFPVPRCVEFYHESLDNFFRVESYPMRLVICSGKPSLSQRDKERFVHLLAAEGLIADGPRWSPNVAVEKGTPEIRWITDPSRFKLRHKLTRLAVRLSRPFLGTATMLLLLSILILEARVLLSLR